MAKYRGVGCVSRFFTNPDDPAAILKVKMQPHQVHFFTKIMEAYSHLILVSPVNSREGIVALYAMPESMADVIEIVNNFPHPVEVLE